VTKWTCAIVTIAAMSAACGSGDVTRVSAAAAPAPAAEPAAPVPASDAHVVVRPEPTVDVRKPAKPTVKGAPVRVVQQASVTPAARVPEYREFTLPAGTTLSLELRSTVASDESAVEDVVRARLRESIAVDGHQVLPAGVEVAGAVTETERAGRVKGRARVAFQFTSLRYDDERIAMRTQPIEHVAEATTGEDATKIGVGAGAGAVIGGILGGKSGAMKGAAIGGAAGTGAVLATRGKDVRLEPGTEVPATLAAPLTVRVRLN
jgi:hypothetical protein